MCIRDRPSDPQKMTANSKAPLVFNLKNRKGRQVILNNSEYTTRHNIMEEVKKRSEQTQDEQVQEMIGQAKEATRATQKAEGQE